MLVAVVLGTAGCAGTQSRLEPLSVTLADIRPAQIGLLEQEYAIKIRVQNPNNADIHIEGLSYQIDLNGKPFAKGVSRQSTSVRGFGEVVLDATAVGNLGAIMNQVVQIQSRRRAGELQLPPEGQARLDAGLDTVRLTGQHRTTGTERRRAVGQRADSAQYC